MAHRKAGGSTQLGRDSQPKYLGVKIYGGQPAEAGNIIVRQRGTRFHVGANVARAEDDSIYSLVKGTVRFTKKKVRDFTAKLVWRQYVHVDKISE